MRTSYTRQNTPMPYFYYLTSIILLFLLPAYGYTQCTIPAAPAECTPPSTYDINVNIPAGTVLEWNDDGTVTVSPSGTIVPLPNLGKPSEISGAYRFSGGGTVEVKTNVTNGDVKLLDDAVLVLENLEFIVANGNLSQDGSNSRLIVKDSKLRTKSNLSQTEGSFQCIIRCIVEIGDEDASQTFDSSTDQYFNTDGSGNINMNSTNGNWENDKGTRYVEASCVNVTADFNLSGDGSNGEDIIINSSIEYGDKGEVNASDEIGIGLNPGNISRPVSTDDGIDSGQWSVSSGAAQGIYNSQIVGASGNFTNSGELTLCGSYLRNNSGSIANQSDATVDGADVILAARIAITNSGTWNASVSKWFSEDNNFTNVTNIQESTEVAILGCFITNYCGIVLPVELITFQAKRDGEGVELFWETASEIDNSHFELQRSENAKDFESIAKIKGQGTNVDGKSYYYTDKDLPLKEKLYYRLKQVDFDGAYEFSEVIVVNVDHKFNQELELYPNPTSEYIYMGLESGLEINRLEVVDFFGKSVKTLFNFSGRRLSVVDLQSGTYILLLHTSSGSFNRIFTILEN